MLNITDLNLVWFSGQAGATFLIFKRKVLFFLNLLILSFIFKKPLCTNSLFNNCMTLLTISRFSLRLKFQKHKEILQARDNKIWVKISNLLFWKTEARRQGLLMPPYTFKNFRIIKNNKTQEKRYKASAQLWVYITHLYKFWGVFFVK